MRLALVDRQWLLAGGSWSESASEWRWDGLELAVGRRECQRPVTELAAILRRRVELVRQGGWEVSSLSCRFLYLHSGVPMASLAEYVAGLIELAGQLGVGVVHVPGLVGEEGEWSGWQNCLQNWLTVAERHNVRLACEWLGEPPGCWENQSASFAGIAYDLGSRLVLGGDVAGELRILADRLLQIRLKDRIRSLPDQLRPLGEGCLRLTVLARLLQSISYQGCLVLDQPAVVCDKSALQRLGDRLRQVLLSGKSASSSVAA